MLQKYNWDKQWNQIQKTHRENWWNQKLVLQKDKLHKYLAILNKKRENTQNSKIRNERGKRTTHFGEIKRITGEYPGQLCTNEVDNLEEIDKFLEKHKLPKLTQELENLNRIITNKEVKLVIEKLSTKKNPKLRWFHSWILSNIQRRVNTSSSENFQKITEKGICPSSFYENTTTLILKPDNATTQTNKITR